MRKDSYEEHVRKIELALEMARDAEPGSLEARLRDELEVKLAGINTAQVRRRRAVFEAQRATRMKNQTLNAGLRAAFRLRCCIRAILGAYTACLSKYGIAPRRRRQRHRSRTDLGEAH